MTANASTPATKKVSEEALNDIKALNRQHEYFYTRVLGAKVGTCPTTVGFIGKQLVKGKVVYYACRELYSIFHSFQWHICFLSDIEQRITNKAQKIKRYASLASAVNYLNN